MLLKTLVPVPAKIFLACVAFYAFFLNSSILGKILKVSPKFSYTPSFGDDDGGFSRGRTRHWIIILEENIWLFTKSINSENSAFSAISLMVCHCSSSGSEISTTPNHSLG